MVRTGRRIPGPAANLVELEHDGLRHTAIVFKTIHRGHRCLNANLEVGMGFMTDPQVTGLARLAQHIPDEGAFIYPTGTVWSVAELVRELAETGDVGGVKAGLELCYLVGEILVEAADQSQHSHLTGHGSIDPWRLLVKADGQVSVAGYGLPRPEVELFLEDENRVPTEDSLRYCAPENLKNGGESDLSSDLFSLSLVALELMVGRPVYDGLVADVRNQASRAEAGRRLYQWRDRLPETVRETLGKALKPDPDIRYRDGLDFVYSVHDLLGGIDAGDGPSLRELVAKVRARQKRGVAAVGGNTGALTRAELAELAADIDDDGAPTNIQPPRRARPEEPSADEDKPRWSRATRKSRGAEPEPTPEPSRRRRSRPSIDEEPGENGESARDRLLRRLRERTDPDGSVSGPRRRRPSASPSEAPPAAAAPASAPAPGRAVASTPAPAPVRSAASASIAPGPSAPSSPAASLAPSTPIAPIESAPTERRRRGGRGAALLERLRSTSGGVTAINSLAPDDGDDEDTMVEVIPPSVLNPPRRLAAPIVSDDEEEDLDTTVVPAEMARQVLEPPKNLEAMETTFSREPTQTERRLPPAAENTGLMVAVLHEGRRVQIPWQGPGATAELAAEQLGVQSTDLFGTRLAAFWLRKDGVALPPDAAVHEAELWVLPNRPVAWDLQLPTGQTTVLVGAAVTVGALNRALGATVGLQGPVVIERNGEPLHPSMPAGIVPPGKLAVRR